MRHGDHLIATWVGHCLDHLGDRHADRRNVHQGVRQDDLPDDHRGGYRSDRRHHADADAAQNHQQNDADDDQHRHHADADGYQHRPVVRVEQRRRNGELRRTGDQTDGHPSRPMDDQTVGHHHSGDHHGNEETNS